MFWFHQKYKRLIRILFVLTWIYLAVILYNLFQTQCEMKLIEINENKSEGINHVTAQKNRSKPQETRLIKYPICKHNFELIILVKSSVSHFGERMFIRNTWGENAFDEEEKWKTFFLVAITNDIKDLQSLKEEVDEFNDVIIGHPMDDCTKMPLQQFGFEWSITHCNFRYLLKADDHVFVNVVNLLNFLYSEDTPKSKLYAGSVHFAADVKRSGMYAVSKKEYKRSVYPKYCSDICFVLSADAVMKMHKNIPDVPLLKISDAYNGLLALASGINPMHNEKFQLSKTCIFKKNDIMQVPRRIMCKKILTDKYKLITEQLKPTE